MIAGERTRQFEFEAARRRLVEHLEPAGAPAAPTRRVVVLTAALGLFGLTFAARLAVHDPDALLANFYVVPIALVAVELGPGAGLVAASAALGLVFAWSAIQTVHVGVLGYTSRGAAFFVVGASIGIFAERQRADIAVRRRTQRHLALYAEQLEGANRHLAMTVEQLEAFAEIARAVGGETDLARVLSLILEHGGAIVKARLVVHLPDGDAMLTAIGERRDEGEPERLPVAGSLPGEALGSARPLRVAAGDPRLAQLAPSATEAILVPLSFRGERLGVLTGIHVEPDRRFGDEDEQMLSSIAASAATAVATARSVAAERLRVTIEAGEQARGRWARELHDETLQGLSGARMVLSAGLARGDLGALRRAVETADAHLGEEMRRLRALVAELRPAALDDLGLGPAIESLARRQAALGGFTVDTELTLADGARLSRETEGTIYRIAQEALTNAVKHSGAEAASLSVRQLPDRIEIAVRDDGRGFDPTAVHAGFGLTGMRERALLAGGGLSVDSRAGGPTCVRAVLPIAAEDHSPAGTVGGSSAD
jgi:signal transduction histidine kinase